MKLIYQVEDKVKFGPLLIFAVQQLLAIMTATLVVPIIVGNGMSPAAALFGAGCGTLIYILFTQKKSPVFLGSSFAFIGSMCAAFAGGVSVSLGYLGMIIGAVFAGLVYVVIALIVNAVGVDWINKLMPAVVIGPTVAIIGLSLAGNAVGDITSGGIKVDGAFLVTARIPQTDFIPGLERDENGYVVTHERVLTNIPGLFAAGDCCQPHFRQAVIAAGDGAYAAMAMIGRAR